jgi:hypothetical protein
MGQGKAGDRPGHAHGQRAFVVAVFADVAALVQEHPLGGSQRRFLAEVEGRGGSVGAVVYEEASAADVARGGERHGQCKGSGHGSIHGVAAALEDIASDLGRQVVAADHHAIPCRRWRAAGLGGGDR